MNNIFISRVIQLFWRPGDTSYESHGFNQYEIILMQID